MAAGLHQNASIGDGAMKRRSGLGTLAPATLPHLEAALKRQWKRYRKDLRCCQEQFSEKAVHDSRVQTRRLLSIVGLLEPFLAEGRPERARATLQRHLDTFNDLRDTHVQLVSVRRMERSFTAARDFRQHLERREARFTRRTRKAIKRIKSRRLRKLIACCRADVRAWRQKGSSEQANRLLLQGVNNAFRRTRRLRDRIDPKKTDSIHRTRVAFKRFRYMVETLARDLPGADAKFLDSMHQYQTLMGNVQDAEVLLCTYDKFVAKKRIDLTAAELFRAELLQRRTHLIAIYLKRSGQLLAFWPDNTLQAITQGEAPAPRPLSQPPQTQFPPRFPAEHRLRPRKPATSQ